MEPLHPPRAAHAIREVPGRPTERGVQPASDTQVTQSQHPTNHRIKHTPVSHQGPIYVIPNHPYNTAGDGNNAYRKRPALAVFLLFELPSFASISTVPRLPKLRV